MQKYKFHIIFFITALLIIVITRSKVEPPLRLIGVVEIKAHSKDIGTWYTLTADNKKYDVTVKRPVSMILGEPSCNLLHVKTPAMIFPANYYLINQSLNLNNCNRDNYVDQKEPNLH